MGLYLAIVVLFMSCFLMAFFFSKAFKLGHPLPWLLGVAAISLLATWLWSGGRVL